MIWMSTLHTETSILSLTYTFCSCRDKCAHTIQIGFQGPIWKPAPSSIDVTTQKSGRNVPTVNIPVQSNVLSNDEKPHMKRHDHPKPLIKINSIPLNVSFYDQTRLIKNKTTMLVTITSITSCTGSDAFLEAACFVSMCCSSPWIPFPLLHSSCFLFQRSSWLPYMWMLINSYNGQILKRSIHSSNSIKCSWFGPLRIHVLQV